MALAAALLLGLGGFAVSTQLKIGDLDPGAPELRADSRYNRDNAFITSHYALSSDVFAVIVKTPPEGCLKYATLDTVDRLAWELQQLPQVRMTQSLPDVVRQITAGSFEGNPKWVSISRNQDVLNYGAQQASVNTPDMFNTECSVMPLVAFLTDHKAETLSAVLGVVERFIAERPEFASGEEAVRKYKKGDEVEAVVLAIDVDKERISLGIKQLDGDPFTTDDRNGREDRLPPASVESEQALLGCLLMAATSGNSSPCSRTAFCTCCAFSRAVSPNASRPRRRRSGARSLVPFMSSRAEVSASSAELMPFLPLTLRRRTSEARTRFAFFAAKISSLQISDSQKVGPFSTISLQTSSRFN